MNKAKALQRFERDLKTLYAHTDQTKQPLPEEALVKIHADNGEVDLLDPMFVPVTAANGDKAPSRAAREGPGSGLLEARRRVARQAADSNAQARLELWSD